MIDDFKYRQPEAEFENPRTSRHERRDQVASWDKPQKAKDPVGQMFLDAEREGRCLHVVDRRTTIVW